MEHKDSAGNHGVISDGGVQWMTAGRGIVHSEMPVPTPGSMLHGFQLWVNLPAKLKMVKPRYQDLQADKIPVVDSAGASVRVMAGNSGGLEGPIKMRNPGMLLDVHLQPGAVWQQPVPGEFNGFAYVYEGSGRIGDKSVQIEHAYVLHNEGDAVEAKGGDGGLKFLLVAGKPIGEPIVQYGPFVMNYESEIQQASRMANAWQTSAAAGPRGGRRCTAFEDYHSGRLQNLGDNPFEDDEL
eukprot:scaffold12.g7945.t1